jgi:hypothetical protein
MSKSAFLRQRDYVAALTHRDAMRCLADANAAYLPVLADAKARLDAACAAILAHSEPVPPDSATAFVPPADTAAGLAARILAA